jgi:hypothetical protein
MQFNSGLNSESFCILGVSCCVRIAGYTHVQIARFAGLEGEVEGPRELKAMTRHVNREIVNFLGVSGPLKRNFKPSGLLASCVSIRKLRFALLPQ